jgi:hypothetical protein
MLKREAHHHRNLPLMTTHKYFFKKKKIKIKKKIEKYLSKAEKSTDWRCCCCS